MILLIYHNYHKFTASFKGTYIEEGNNMSNIVLVGLFGAHLHERGADCSKVIDRANGIYLIEAMRYAVDNINREHNTIFGKKLGFRIYDTCRSVNIMRGQVASFSLIVKHADILKGQYVGIIGPPTSEEAKLSYALLDTTQYTVISYSANSIELNDKKIYRRFFRTVPSGDLQSNALLDVIKYFQWKYISIVNSHVYFDQRGMDLSTSMLKQEGICVSSRNVLPRKPTKQDFDYIIRNLNRKPIARIVVLFTTLEDTKMLLKSAAGSKSKFQWLSSSEWDPNMQAIEGVREAANGAIMLSYVDINNEKFLNHFKGLTLNKNRYGWFEEFWQQQFNCTTKKDGRSTKKECTGDESLLESDFYADHAASQAVIDAVNAYTVAIRCYCKLWLPNFQPNSWIRMFIEHRLKMPKRCMDPYNALRFDARNNYHRDISILNFDGTTYKTIGTWKSKPGTKEPILNIDKQLFAWYDGSSKPPESTCSKACKIGERKIISKIKECCFTCKACTGSKILQNNQCTSCDKFSKPNGNKTKCERLQEMRINMASPFGVTIITASVVGLILNTIVLVLFIKYKDSKIIKSSSRELSFFMMGGLYLCFISPLTFMMDPTKVRCGLRRFIFGISLTACYTPLVLKTNRIYRLFTAARVMVSMPPLVSPRSQIAICFGLLALQLLLCIMWVVGAPPVITQSVVNDGKMVADLCGANIVTIIVNILPCFCLMAVSTVYAFKSRKFPKNYNEASIIGFTMYVSFVLWALFIPFLLLVNAHNSNPFTQTYVIANFTNLIGLVTLCGLFGPKIRRLFTVEEVTNVQMEWSQAKVNEGCSCDHSTRASQRAPQLGNRYENAEIDGGALESTASTSQE